MGRYYYAIMWLTIGVISSIDIYWAITNQDMMMELEENPIGRYLIEKDGGSIALFMCVKGIGTVIVLGTLVTLYHWKKKYAWPIIISLTIVQFCLLYYLGQYGLTSTSKKNEDFQWPYMNINAKLVNISFPKNSQ